MSAPGTPPELARYDAEVAAGNSGYAIDAEVASASIDAFLHERLAGSGDWAGSVHLHCTDVAGEWLVVRAAGGAPIVTREHAKGACALRGPASNLLLALWRRTGLDDIDVVGDAALAERFVAATDLG